MTHSVHITSYVPRFSSLPHWLPTAFELFCKYAITFSLALGLLNAVPCYSLDGQFILSALVDALLVRRVSTKRRRTLCNIIMYIGTTLMIVNVLIGIIKFIRPYYYKGGELRDIWWVWDKYIICVPVFDDRVCDVKTEIVFTTQCSINVN